MYASYLKLAPRCAKCSADFAVADPGDGPAVFVVLVVGAIVTPLLFILQLGFKLPDWIAVSVTMLVAIGLCLTLLPIFKATLFALQWKHRAGQVTNRDVSGN